MKQILMAGQTVHVPFVCRSELSETSRVFCFKTLHCSLFNYKRRGNDNYARSFIEV